MTTTAKQVPHPEGVGGDFLINCARLLGVIAHPMRLAILEALCEQPRCVKHINALVPLPQSRLSQHLSALRKADLVASLACGSLRCYYLLQPTLVKNLIGLLRQEHPVEKHDCVSIVRKHRSEQRELAKGA
ncbi:MAG: winged helix-turn-helix transcriptional regulator [Pirellulaceae bacterium]|nr:winged helix-turn-helix transcriptional regulator [Pirellulaceae bacterium]